LPGSYSEDPSPVEGGLEGNLRAAFRLFKIPFLEKIRESVSFDVTRGMEIPGKLFFSTCSAR